MIVAKVAINNTSYKFDKLFDYVVPSHLSTLNLIGCMVIVPFGCSNARRDALVFDVSECDDDTYDVLKLKQIISVVDTSPVLTRELITLALWMTSRYYCTLYKAARTMLPANLVSKSKKQTTKVIALADDIDLNTMKLSEKQSKVCMFVRDKGNAYLKEVCYYVGVTNSVVQTLVKKGILVLLDSNENIDCDTIDELQIGHSKIVLTNDQSAAYESLRAKYRSNAGEIALLYGVTGSGKTSVFMRLIDDVANTKTGVIVMVPEISLTPQMISMFKQRYGSNVAVFHSRLTVRERFLQWDKVRKKEATIVIGTRSAVFAPLDNVGIIIIDEEQEYTYKSEKTPRFHARDIAKFRAVYNKGLLVLSSATPSIETFYFASRGDYSLYKLPSRYGAAKLPKVTVVDMNAEVMNGNTGQVSAQMLRCLRENVAKGNQSIVLLNRRGYNTFASCRSCSETVTCPNCSISLIYHRVNEKLMCHYCGYSVDFFRECPHCHQMTINYSGAGTQKAEEEIAGLLPGARILRMDADTTMSKLAHETAFEDFRKGKYDVMLGTQMIAKGLDFPGVTLVGVLSADQALYSNDFRSYERAFSLITQVVGRSGRSGGDSEAIIQTYTPENSIIKLASKQDYEGFYETEIKLRKIMLYPPFSDICVVAFMGDNESKVSRAAVLFSQMIREVASHQYIRLPLKVLPPSQATVYKVSGKYRYKIIIKCHNNKEFREMMQQLILAFDGERSCIGVGLSVDVNPDMVL